MSEVPLYTCKGISPAPRTRNQARVWRRRAWGPALARGVCHSGEGPALTLSQTHALSLTLSLSHTHSRPGACLEVEGATSTEDLDCPRAWSLSLWGRGSGAASTRGCAWSCPQPYTPVSLILSNQFLCQTNDLLSLVFSSVFVANTDIN